MAYGNVYQMGAYGQGSAPGGLSIEDLVNDPDLLEALSRAGAGGDISAAMPEGMHVGGTYRAAHPLQFAAAIGQRIAGGLNQRRLNEAMARVLRGRYGPQQPPPVSKFQSSQVDLDREMGP